MKRVSQKQTNRNCYPSISKLALIVFLAIITFSCSNDDDDKCDGRTNAISQEIKDLIYFNGEESASTVVITVPGGPSPALATELVDFLASNFDNTDIIYVTAHQSQTLNTNILEGDEMTLEQGVDYNAASVETLSQVIQYFKNQGRTVYVAAASFGSFLTQEFIARKGINAADKYLIITGRLDINDTMWQGLAEGKNAYFENGVTPIVDEEPFTSVFNRNEARLFAAVAMNRYTEQFSTIESLSNITYIYGKTDEAVGRLTDAEVMFLQSKNANILSGESGHDEPFEGFLAQGFLEAFGIE